MAEARAGREGRALGPLYLLFAVSGAAGLVYELVWTRYLALFVGHDAYAQVLVIAIFLGGMALGALAVGQRSRALRRPLAWYVGVEVLLGVLGLLFHPMFVGARGFAYETLFPFLGSGAPTVTARWIVAALLILPQSALLGTTFPLMTAGVLRRAPGADGRRIATLYFANSIGAAGGVVAAGFFLVGVVGLPGTLATAAALNFAAAGGVWAAALRGEPDEAAAPEAATVPGGGPTGGAAGVLWPILLATSFLTAVASFIYEIDWIRMLSLVMGSATHSFEIMLSAFILGLALGALAIRRHADRIARPLRALGWIQWLMGLTALATLPLYLESFDVMAWMVNHLPATDSGYLRFGAYRYLIAVAVMFPSTFLAGTTLPLITKTLLARGAGERAIGWVYGINTLGSIVGVFLAGLVLLPWLGIEGLLVAGAALDMAVGVALLRVEARRRSREEGAPAGRRPRLARTLLPAGLAAATLLVAVAGGGIRFDRSVLSSGVYRYGTVSGQDEEPVLYYADGRTATVSAYLYPPSELILLATNGKPDASLTRRWIRAARGEEVERGPITQGDEATQALSGLVPIAHRPDARTAAIVGHGSGMTAHHLLSSPAIERLTTIEIEPRMVDGSRVYYPANRRVFDDLRSRIVIDDARAWFASRPDDRYDLVVSEPSNPWVSGTASLFTEEFYRRIRPILTPDGVFVQWLQLYEIDDPLVTTVLAALHRVFPDFRAYVVGATDLLVVATVAEELAEPDWSVFGRGSVREELDHVPAFTPGYLDALVAFDAEEVAPLLEGWSPVNSDFRPVLEHRSEKLRFFDRFASGLYAMAIDRFDVAAGLSGRTWATPGYDPVPVWASEAMRISGLGAWLRKAIRGEERPATEALRDPPRPEWSSYGEHVASVLETFEAGEPPDDWHAWLDGVLTAEDRLHDRTAGYADDVFYGRLAAFLERTDAPGSIRAAVALVRGLAAHDFEAAAAASERVLADATLVQRFPDHGLLLDGTVVARLRVGDPAGARAAYERLAPLAGRAEGDFRDLLLEAHLEAADAPGSPP